MPNRCYLLGGLSVGTKKIIKMRTQEEILARFEKAEDFLGTQQVFTIKN